MTVTITALAIGFYVLLILYGLSELYYNRAYWRLILKKKRRTRWELLLLNLRIMLIAVGLIVITLAMLST